MKPSKYLSRFQEQLQALRKADRERSSPSNRPLSQIAVERAEELYCQFEDCLPKCDQPLLDYFELEATSYGGLQLSWDEGGFQLTVAFQPEGELDYLFIGNCNQPEEYHQAAESVAIAEIVSLFAKSFRTDRFDDADELDNFETLTEEQWQHWVDRQTDPTRGDWYREDSD